jgi:hypothetical protein
MVSDCWWTWGSQKLFLINIPVSWFFHTRHFIFFSNPQTNTVYMMMMLANIPGALIFTGIICHLHPNYGKIISDNRSANNVMMEKCLCFLFVFWR